MIELKVTGMTCGGCVNSVKKAIARVEPGASVEVDLATGRVTVESPSGQESAPVNRSGIEKAIVNAGFAIEAL